MGKKSKRLRQDKPAPSSTRGATVDDDDAVLLAAMEQVRLERDSAAAAPRALNPPTGSAAQPVHEFARPGSDYSCRVCGKEAPHVCTRCKIARYCSRDCLAADWKAVHKKECATCQLTDKRAVIITATIDLARVLGDEGAARFLPNRFLTGVLMLTPSGLTMMMMELSHGHELTALVHITGAYLRLTVNIAPTPRDAITTMFSWPRETPDGVSMPLGVPDAVAEWTRDVSLVMLAQPDGSTWKDMCQELLKFTATKSWKYSRNVCPPRSLAHEAEAKLYDDSFLHGFDVTADYPAQAVPVGSRITLLHFSQGLFFKRVDFTTCRDFVAPERVLSVFPLQIMYDCRAMRKSKAEGTLNRMDFRMGEDLGISRERLMQDMLGNYKAR